MKIKEVKIYSNRSYTYFQGKRVRLLKSEQRQFDPNSNEQYSQLEKFKLYLNKAENLLDDENDLVCISLNLIEQPEGGNRLFELVITDRLRKQCKNGKIWKSKEMLTAIKNAAYGFDPIRAKSPGGRDGIFLLTRDYKPNNAMMRKLFDHFIDKTGSGVESIAQHFGCAVEDLIPVRLVSHHMRLLGVLSRGPGIDCLVLVDYDDTKAS